ncbi:sigma factor-like helix-turn-helix DNA-binding protein [Streptosporangium canum]
MSNSGPGPHARRNSAQTAEQTAASYELRLTGLTIREIATRLGIPSSTVHVRLTAALQERVDPLVDQYRAVELDRLDRLTVKAWEVLEQGHVVVQHGKIVRDEDGNPVRDDGPVLQAIGTLLRISERRSKLLGLDAPIAVDANVHQVDPADIELLQMIESAKRAQAVEEARLRGELPAGAESAAEADGSADGTL